MSLDDAKKGTYTASVEFDASSVQFVLKELGFIGPALIVGTTWWDAMTNEGRKFWLGAVSTKKAISGFPRRVWFDAH